MCIKIKKPDFAKDMQKIKTARVAGIFFFFLCSKNEETLRNVRVIKFVHVENNMCVYLLGIC